MWFLSVTDYRDEVKMVAISYTSWLIYILGKGEIAYILFLVKILL